MAVWGLHGVKQCWVGQTVRDGLRRDSAAWFLALFDMTDDHIDATIAAAIYLALAPSTRARLVADAGPGRYAALFAREPGLMPGLLVFRDRPTGEEILHRYVWQHRAAPLPTAPYTKVARAGRHVPPRGAEMWVHRFDLRQLAAIERGVDRAAEPDPWWRDPGLLRRVEPGEPVREVAGPLHDTKIGAVCWALARTARAAVRARTGGD